MTNVGRKKSHAVYLDRDLLQSRAWLELGGTAPQVYGLFRCRMQVVREGKPGRGQQRRSPYRIANNGRLVFSYREAQAKYGFTSPRFRRALDELVRHGFLDVAHAGGGTEGDATLWAISDRWRAYGTPDFKAATLPKGRLWTTRAANENVRGGTNENVRGLPGGAHENVRGLAAFAGGTAHENVRVL